MQYLFDREGRRYVDAYNNVPHVGHCHPRVVEAAERQMRVLNTNTRYLNELLERYAEALLATMPRDRSRCAIFVSSASEANELALRLARAETGRTDTIVLEAAYHGNTTSLIDISPYKHAGPGGAARPTGSTLRRCPTTIAASIDAATPRPGAKYASHVAERSSMHCSNRRRCRGVHRRNLPECRRSDRLPAALSGEGLRARARRRRRVHRR